MLRQTSRVDFSELGTEKSFDAWVPVDGGAAAAKHAGKVGGGAPEGERGEAEATGSRLRPRKHQHVFDFTAVGGAQFREFDLDSRAALNEAERDGAHQASGAVWSPTSVAMRSASVISSAKRSATASKRRVSLVIRTLRRAWRALSIFRSGSR